MSDETEKSTRVLPRVGMLKGKFVVPDDFDEMMRDEIQKMFEGDEDQDEPPDEISE